LVSFFVNGLKILLIYLLHVTQSFLEVQGISVTAGESIRQLLSQSTHICLRLDPTLSFLLILVFNDQVFIGSYGPLLLLDKLSQNEKLLLQFHIFGFFDLRLLSKLISFTLQIFYLDQKFLRVASRREIWNCSSHWRVVCHRAWSLHKFGDVFV
jgi:hypothetical protein